VLDHLLLAAAEALVAEDPAQDFQCGRCLARAGRHRRHAGTAACRAGGNGWGRGQRVAGMSVPGRSAATIARAPGPGPGLSPRVRRGKAPGKRPDRPSPCASDSLWQPPGRPGGPTLPARLDRGSPEAKRGAVVYTRGAFHAVFLTRRSLSPDTNEGPS